MRTLIAIAALLIPTQALATTQGCGNGGLAVQVLGSGGPEAGDGRASSSYLVWRNGRARVLVDLGSGALLRFEQAGARIADLRFALLTHLHADHSADLPALLKASYFTSRDDDLPVYGPSGSGIWPSTGDFFSRMFGAGGAPFEYLSGYVEGGERYRVLPREVSTAERMPRLVLETGPFRISAVAVHHGPVPALAWRIESDDSAIVFSGDMNGDYETLPRLAASADLLVAHHAVPESARGVARNLHMPPSVIGTIAAKADVKQLVLSHRMHRTLGREPESRRAIREHYQGPLAFADDGDCFQP